MANDIEEISIKDNFSCKSFNIIILFRIFARKLDNSANTLNFRLYGRVRC